MSVFRESERLRRSFIEASGGRFDVVYRALCAAAKEAGSATLSEADVLARIAAIAAKKQQEEA